jgi:3'-phosphoadenosine 5'-phosphosulfate sulfotransferase (PAPS reductase)/FAD synthetase
MYPDVVGVFNDTGLEYPEIKDFVKTYKNIVWLKPKINYQQSVKKHGFAIISKEVAQKVSELKHGTDKLKAIRRYGYPETKNGKLSNKWQFLAKAPFELSGKCCDHLKKNPGKKFEKETGLHPFVGTMAEESNLRRVNYLTHGCNNYDATRPVSKPISIWTEKNIWEYLRSKNIPYSKIYDMGYERTGCSWCLMGLHMEKGENRLQKLKKTHPKLWNYAINKMGLREPLEYIGINFGEEEPPQGIQDEMF